MTCEQALNNRDDFLDKTLTDQEAVAIQSHLACCQSCREEFQFEEMLRTTLPSLPVPPPSDDFVKRSFATALARHKKQRIKKIIPLAAGAMAACLALWLIVAGPISPIAPTAQPELHAINITLNDQRLVQVIVDAPRDLLQAAVVIELPPQLEMAGFPGQREIRWNTNLRKGKNLLNLPLIAKSEGIAELITHITHDNKSKILSMVMKVSPGELTKMGHYSAATA